MKVLRGAAWAVLWLALAGVAAGAAAEERHVGYYYPDITSSETYRARAEIAPGSERNRRIGFVVAHAARERSRPYPPRYVLFAKGSEAEKLIVVALDDEVMATIYRARAVLAQLTAEARASELFRNLAVEDWYTFFDLARLLGFEEIVVSDGRDYAHRVILE